jgi:hypothetical protein
MTVASPQACRTRIPSSGAGQRRDQANTTQTTAPRKSGQAASDIIHHERTPWLNDWYTAEKTPTMTVTMDQMTAARRQARLADCEAAS